MNTVKVRHGYQAQGHEAKAKPKLLLNHEAKAEAEAKALTFWKHESEAKAEAGTHGFISRIGEFLSSKINPLMRTQDLRVHHGLESPNLRVVASRNSKAMNKSHTMYP